MVPPEPLAPSGGEGSTHYTDDFGNMLPGVSVASTRVRRASHEISRLYSRGGGHPATFTIVTRGCPAPHDIDFGGWIGSFRRHRCSSGGLGQPAGS